MQHFRKKFSDNLDRKYLYRFCQLRQKLNENDIETYERFYAETKIDEDSRCTYFNLFDKEI